MEKRIIITNYPVDNVVFGTRRCTPRHSVVRTMYYKFKLLLSSGLIVKRHLVKINLATENKF